MKFNEKDLWHLAVQSADQFECEGVLFIKERQETFLDLFIAQPEVFVERWCRLRGNLLMYLKTKDPFSDPAGIFVLERFNIQFFPACELPHHFVVAFEEDERLQYFAAPSEAERDTWIEALHLTSYECIKMQFNSLKAEVRARSGQQPLLDHDALTTSFFEDQQSWDETTSLSPTFELLLACERLPFDGDGRPPNPVVYVSTKDPKPDAYSEHSDADWTKRGQTEIQRQNPNPCFFVTLPIFDVAMETELKIVVLDMRERVSKTATRIGQASFHVKSLIMAPGEQLKLPLHSGVQLPIPRRNSLHHSTGHRAPSSHDVSHVNGVVVVKAWRKVGLERLRGFDAADTLGFDDFPGDEDDADDDADDDGDEKQSPTVEKVEDPAKNSRRLLATLNEYFSHIVLKTYRLPARDDSQLSVCEFMGESDLMTKIPTQLIHLWVKEEMAKVDELRNLGSLPGGWETVRVDLINSHLQLVNDYKLAAGDVQALHDLTFKPSTVKMFQEYEFFPTNLHLQCLWVENLDEQRFPPGIYSTFTVGAFTAFSQGYQRGGLRRILEHITAREGPTPPTHSTPGTDSTAGILAQVDTNSLGTIRETLKSMEVLKDEIDYFASMICQAANRGSPHEMYSYRSYLTDKTRQLSQVCDNRFLEDAVEALDDAKSAPHVEGAREASEGAPIDVESHGDGGVFSVANPDADENVGDHSETSAPSADTWRWAGNRFVTDDCVTEPWEITRLNVEASLVCVVTKVEDLVRAFAMNPEDAVASMTTWLPQVSPLVLKLQACVKSMTERAALGLAFAAVLEHSQSFHSSRSILSRRDVCFSQAATSLVAAFVSNLRVKVLDDTFLKQIHQIGILACFESLLSCYGDELAMLEDMAVAVADLRTVYFKLEETENPRELMPIISGSRQSLTVSVPVATAVFALLPKELQRGKLVKVVPVLFSVGINRKAAVAEKYSMITRYIKQPEFGDTSLQDKINRESMEILNSYYEKFAAVTENPDGDKSWGSSLSLSQMLPLLRRNVVSRKSKNVDVLNIASQICREMSGLKFTSCKSAKDRTAMAVTLQQCHLLQLHHHLDPRASTHALEVMRSDGVRLVNVQKNIGQRKYHFDAAQIPALPKNYRPPPGTYTGTL